MTKYFGIPFANAGDKVPVPNGLQPGGEVSYTEGWGPDYEADQESDPSAKDISRTAENQLKFDITEALKELQELGFKVYASDVNYPVTAYTVGSDGRVYQAAIVNGPASSIVDPVGDGTGTWFPALGHSIQTVLTASNPAWNPNPLTKVIEFMAIGGGGGAGGVNGQGVGTAGVSSGGGGGSTVVKRFNNAGGPFAIIVGAGGAGGAPGNTFGNGGGITSIIGPGVNLQAGGGGGGFGQTASAGDQRVPIGAGGSGLGGDYTLVGGSSSAGYIVGGVRGSESFSGGSYGGPGKPSNAGPAFDGDGFGEGGGGVSVFGTADQLGGGDGFQGVVIIKEYL